MPCDLCFSLLSTTFEHECGPHILSAIHSTSRGCESYSTFEHKPCLSSREECSRTYVMLSGRLVETAAKRTDPYGGITVSLEKCAFHGIKMAEGAHFQRSLGALIDARSPTIAVDRARAVRRPAPSAITAEPMMTTVAEMLAERNSPHRAVAMPTTRMTTASRRGFSRGL